MTLKLELESEIEERLKEFPQIIERLPEFLREQIALEEWRLDRYSPETRELVSEAIAQAKSSTLTREEAFSRLRSTIGKIAPQLDDENQGGT
jgi:hypothetical protein